VQRVREETVRGPAATPVPAPEVLTATTTTSEPTGLPPAPGMSMPPPSPASSATAPACARPPTRKSPTLREVTLADLGEVRRLLALPQQARARGWLRGGEAAQLTVVAAAVHAKRVGTAPCRLCVALLRD
jgi:hypothetical protein